MVWWWESGWEERVAGNGAGPLGPSLALTSSREGSARPLSCSLASYAAPGSIAAEGLPAGPVAREQSEPGASVGPPGLFTPRPHLTCHHSRGCIHEAAKIGQVPGVLKVTPQRQGWE